MKMLCNGNTVYFAVAENLCDATVTLSDLPRLNVLNANFREPTMAIIK